jgi:hypothetical protein
MKLTVTVLAAAVLAGLAAAAAPSAHHTAAGAAAAKSSLLTNTDLGKAWKSAVATGTPGLHLSCKGWSPSAKGIVETGAASSPNFANTSAGPFVQQETSVYATSDQASAYWNRAVQAGLVACVVQSVEALRSQGIKVAIVSKGGLPVTKPTKLTTGYRVVASLTSPGHKPEKLYFDVVLVGRGNGLSQITMTSFVAPVPAAVESALAKLVASRLGVPTA